MGEDMIGARKLPETESALPRRPVADAGFGTAGRPLGVYGPLGKRPVENEVVRDEFTGFEHEVLAVADAQVLPSPKTSGVVAAGFRRPLLVGPHRGNSKKETTRRRRRAWRMTMAMAGVGLATLFATGAPTASAHGPIGPAGDADCNGLGLSGPIAPGSTHCKLTAAQIIFVTNYGPEGQTPTRCQPLVTAVNVKTLIDVDNCKLGFDLEATILSLNPAQAKLEVKKLAGASATLPVSIVAHAVDPNDATVRYMVGYDARRDGAPQTFVETFTPRTGGLNVVLSGSGAPSAALLGGRAVVSSRTGEELEAVEARVHFTPLPGTLQADVAQAEASGVKTTEAKLRVGVRSKVDVDFASSQGQDHVDLTGTLDKVQSAQAPAQSATFKLVQSPVPNAADPKTELILTTSGSPRIANCNAALVEKNAGVLKKKTTATLEDLPSSATITLEPQTSSTPKKVTVDAAQPFTLVDIGEAKNGEPKKLPDDRYAYSFNDGTLESTAARIRGLEKATLQLSEELVGVQATASAGPFRVLVDEPDKGKRVEATIQDMPSTVDFTLRPKSTPTIRYRGSANIAQTRVTVHDEAGVAKTEKFQRGGNIVQLAKDLEVVASGLPTDLTISLTSDPKKIELTATDAKPGATRPGNPADIGSLTVTLSTGGLTGDDKAFRDSLNTTNPRTRVGTPMDGALVRDRYDRYVIFARVTSLHSATLELDQEPLRINLKHGSQYGASPPPDAMGRIPLDLALQNARRPFHALVDVQVPDLVQEPDGGVISNKSVDAYVQDLPREIDLKIRKTTTQTDPTITYEGSDQIALTTVKMHDDAGIVTSLKTEVPANDLLATLTNIPTRVTASFAVSAGSPKIDVEARRPLVSCNDCPRFERPRDERPPTFEPPSFATQLAEGSTVELAAEGTQTSNRPLMPEPQPGHPGLKPELIGSERFQPAPIGKVEVQLWTRLTGRADLLHPDDQSFVNGLGTAKDGAYVLDGSRRYVIFARLKGLTDAHLSLDPQLLELKGPVDPFTGLPKPGLAHDAGAFHAQIGEFGKSIDVQINDLPAKVTLVIKPKGKPTIDYTGSAKITNTKIKIDDDLPAGIAQGDRGAAVAHDLLVKIRDLPTSVVASLDPSGKDMELEAKSAPTGQHAPIGRVDVQLWSQQAGTPPEELPGQDQSFVNNLALRDGALVRDLSDRYVVFARISELKTARLVLGNPGNPPDVKLETGVRRDFVLDIASQGPIGKPNQEITATVANRPTCMRFRLAKDRFTSLTCSQNVGGALPIQNPDPNENPTAILYEGAETTGGMVVDAKGLPDLKGQDLHLRLDGIPPRLEAIVEGSGDTPKRIQVETLGGDGDVDLVEVRVRSGRIDPGDVFDTDLAKDAQLDGVLIRSKRDANQSGFPIARKVVLARISLLKRALVRTTPSLRMEVDSLARREFRLIKEEDKIKSFYDPLQGATVSFLDTEYLRATASALQPNTTLTFSDLTGAVKIGYRAAGEMPSLDLDTNVTGSLFVKAHATNVARKLDLCVHPGAPHASLGGDSAVCNLAAFTDGGVPAGLPSGPTIVAEAGPPLDPNNPMEVDFIDCKRLDSDGQCGEDMSPAEFIKVEDLKFRKFALQVHERPGKTKLYLDTSPTSADRQAISGSALILLPPGGQIAKIHATIPLRSVSQVAAQDRPATFDLSSEERRVAIRPHGLRVAQYGWSGEISCPTTRRDYNLDLFLTSSALGHNVNLRRTLCEDNPDGNGQQVGAW